MSSAPRLVLVRPLVGLRLSDSTPRRGSLVRFSGRAALRDAGSTYSTYSRGLRVFRDAVYRVKLPGDGDHVNGFSRRRSVSVH